VLRKKGEELPEDVDPTMKEVLTAVFSITASAYLVFRSISTVGTRGFSRMLLDQRALASRDSTRE